MLFFTSLIYCLLMFVLPCEWLLNRAVAGFGTWPTWQMSAILNLLIYMGILFTLRFGKFIYTDLELHKESEHRQLKEFLDVSGCQWLNLLGLIGITIGAMLVAVNGLLPYSFWFLYTAILLGFWDLYKFNRQELLPTGLPSMRFEESITPLQQDKEVVFGWKMWSDEQASTPQAKSFFFNTGDYQVARGANQGKGKPEAYVKGHLTDSVKQVAAFFREESVVKNHVPSEEIENVVCFVRSIDYASDEDTHRQEDYWNFSIETLYEGDEGGDCEDHAILAASILYLLGHNVALFILMHDDSGHMALGYHDPEAIGPFSTVAEKNGMEYFYVETVPASHDERIGDIDAQFLRNLESIEAVPVA